MVNNARNFKGYNGAFAERLRGIMEDTKTTQEALAKHTGLSRQTISQYMDGSVLPNVEKLYKICNYFNVTSDYFLCFSDSKSMDMTDQHIQNAIGLTKESINQLKTIYNERLKALFPVPSLKIEVINYMLSNQSFMANFPDRLRNYCSLRLEDDKIAERTGKHIKSEETDIKSYLLTRLMQDLADDYYNNLYKLSFDHSNAKRKPGRKRKSDVTNCNDEVNVEN